MSKDKKKKLVKKAVKYLKGKAVDAAAGAVEDKIKDRSRAQRKKHSKGTERVGSLPRHLQPDISVSKTIKLKDRKKSKQKKKIEKWKKEDSAKNAKARAQSAFLALDKKNKK